MTIAAPIRSLYVHVPFCHTICGYCDFYSVVYDRGRITPLVGALLCELDQCGRRYAPALRTIYVGGGTPTTLPPNELSRLLTAVRSDVEFAGPISDRPAESAVGSVADRTCCEFTVEANPATVTPEIADVLMGCAVTRVSIGAQSFHPSELRVLDRLHAPPQVGQTVAICRRAGIPQVNLDLIFAIPGQTLESWLANLRQAVELGPDHLSCYGLTYEHGTPLYERLQRGQVRQADSELEAEMYEATIDTLAAAGYRQYEISNFAKPGCECRHNLVYWRNEQYLGVGPSAAGYVDAVRYRNVPDVAAYVHAVSAGRSPRVEEERRSLDQQARETAMLSLRLTDGLDRRTFAARFGRDATELFADAVRRHVSLGLLEVSDGAIRLTRRGLLLADSVISDFL